MKLQKISSETFQRKHVANVNLDDGAKNLIKIRLPIVSTIAGGTSRFYLAFSRNQTQM